MSDEIKNTVKPVVEAAAGPLGAIIPSGTVLSGTTIYNQPWFGVWVPQTFAGTVSGGYAQPTLSGNGWVGQSNTGFVFQNDQYNTTVRGF
jgi:hypothetical protein